MSLYPLIQSVTVVLAAGGMLIAGANLVRALRAGAFTTRFGVLRSEARPLLYRLALALHIVAILVVAGAAVSAKLLLAAGDPFPALDGPSLDDIAASRLPWMGAGFLLAAWVIGWWLLRRTPR